ncbi:MAG: hypothetical protein LBO09_05125 [Candidatus Peribacteria bacterium]|jgi:sugar-specific transcriptional regulator TrmB|nr:hypothetical protein [Candidatus Peribacteria bacterium]
MELIPLLEQFGFSEKEAKVYLSCLELGQAPVSSIARNVQEQRVTTYSILKNLVARGVAQTFVKNRSTFYSVIPPEKLLQNWETRCEKFKEKLPEFLALTEKFDTHKPKVQFYDGLEGLKYSYEHMVMEAETMPEHDYFMIFL